MPDRTFEDYEPGQVHELGSVAVTQDEIVEFARRYDPQPFHVDPEAAGQSVFGGLIASGWHTAAMWMRLWVDSMAGSTSSQGSPGIEELRWLEPVRPGDTLHGRLTVLDATPSERRPDRVTVRIRGEMVNQDGVTVLSMVSRGHFARKLSG
jgi:acyl dehydratase